MRIFGIDPGVATTGWGVIDSDMEKDHVSCVEYGVVRTVKQQNHSIRLRELHNDLMQLLSEFKPDAVAVEQLFFAKNLKTATSVGEARGVVLLAVEESEIPVYEFTPLQVKDAVCGYGRATKHQVQEMVMSFLGLAQLPSPDDAADGLAIALCCSHFLRNKEVITLRKA